MHVLAKAYGNMPSPKSLRLHRILRNLPKPTSSQNFTRLCSVDDELMQSPSAEDEKFMRESCGTGILMLS